MNKIIKINFFLLLFVCLISCATKKEEIKETVPAPKPAIVEEKDRIGCLSYKIPENMENAPNEAYKYSYDLLILEKGDNFFDSGVKIAIKVYENVYNYSLKKFVDQDQKRLRDRVKIIDEEKWTPKGAEWKNIGYFAFEFTYTIQGIKVYQRSVYVSCETKIYIISLNSLFKEKMLDKKNDRFWESIGVD